MAQKPLALVPHLFTLSSVLCGLYGILLAARIGEPGFDGESLILRASIAVFIGFVFDGIDGLLARRLHSETHFGLELDSLADLVTFGVAPAVLVHQVAFAQIPMLGLVATFAFVGTGALRLARYNVEAATAPRTGPRIYTGLPIPVAGVGLVALLLSTQGLALARDTSAHLLLAATLLVSILMVTPLRFRFPR